MQLMAVAGIILKAAMPSKTFLHRTLPWLVQEYRGVPVPYHILRGKSIDVQLLHYGSMADPVRGFFTALYFNSDIVVLSNSEYRF
jgi:hypothetical protein